MTFEIGDEVLYRFNKAKPEIAVRCRITGVTRIRDTMFYDTDFSWVPGSNVCNVYARAVLAEALEHVSAIDRLAELIS